MSSKRQKIVTTLFPDLQCAEFAKPAFAANTKPTRATHELPESDESTNTRSLIEQITKAYRDPVMAIDAAHDKWAGWADLLRTEINDMNELHELPMLLEAIQQYNTKVVPILYSPQWFNVLTTDVLNQTSACFTKLIEFIGILQKLEAMQKLGDLNSDVIWFQNLTLLAKDEYLRFVRCQMKNDETFELDNLRSYIELYLSPNESAPDNTPNEYVENMGSLPEDGYDGVSPTSSAYLRRRMMVTAACTAYNDPDLSSHWGYLEVALSFVELCCNAAYYIQLRFSGLLAFHIVSIASTIELSQASQMYSDWMYLCRPAHDANTGIINKEMDLLNVDNSRDPGMPVVEDDLLSEGVYYTESILYKHFQLYSTFTTWTLADVERSATDLFLLPSFVVYNKQNRDVLLDLMHDEPLVVVAPSHYFATICFNQKPTATHFWFNVFKYTIRTFPLRASFSATLYSAMTHLFLQSYASLENTIFMENSTRNVPLGWISTLTQNKSNSGGGGGGDSKITMRAANEITIPGPLLSKSTADDRVDRIKYILQVLNRTHNESIYFPNETSEDVLQRENFFKVYDSDRSLLGQSEAEQIYFMWTTVWKMTLMVGYLYGKTDTRAYLFGKLMTRVLSELGSDEARTDYLQFLAHAQKIDTLMQNKSLERLTLGETLEHILHNYDAFVNLTDVSDTNISDFVFFLKKFYRRAADTQHFVVGIVQMCLAYVSYCSNHKEGPPTITHHTSGTDKEEFGPNVDINLAYVQLMVWKTWKVELTAALENHAFIATNQTDSQQLLYLLIETLQCHFNVTEQSSPPHKEHAALGTYAGASLLSEYYLSGKDIPSQSGQLDLTSGQTKSQYDDSTFGELVENIKGVATSDAYLLQFQSARAVAIAAALPLLLLDKSNAAKYASAPVTWYHCVESIAIGSHLLGLLHKFYYNKPVQKFTAPVTALLALISRVFGQTCCVDSGVANAAYNLTRQLSISHTQTQELQTAINYSTGISSVATPSFKRQLGQIWPNHDTTSILDAQTVLGKLTIASHSWLGPTSMGDFTTWSQEQLRRHSIVLHEAAPINLNTILGWVEIGAMGFYGMSWAYNSFQAYKTKPTQEFEMNGMPLEKYMEHRHQIAQSIQYSHAAIQARSAFFEHSIHFFSLHTLSLFLQTVPVLATTAKAILVWIVSLSPFILYPLIAVAVISSLAYWLWPYIERKLMIFRSTKNAEAIERKPTTEPTKNILMTYALEVVKGIAVKVLLPIGGLVASLMALSYLFPEAITVIRSTLSIANTLVELGASVTSGIATAFSGASDYAKKFLNWIIPGSVDIKTVKTFITTYPGTFLTYLCAGLTAIYFRAGKLVQGIKSSYIQTGIALGSTVALPLLANMIVAYMTESPA